MNSEQVIQILRDFESLSEEIYEIIKWAKPGLRHHFITEIEHKGDKIYASLYHDDRCGGDYDGINIPLYAFDNPDKWKLELEAERKAKEEKLRIEKEKRAEELKEAKYQRYLRLKEEFENN